MFTSFSGYDSQLLSLCRLREIFPNFDFECVGWSEIESDAIKAHNSLFPDLADKAYGDITLIDWHKVPDFDLFTMSSPCFVAGTLVLTSEGYKPIEEIKVGDYVLTHTNQYQKVLKVGSKPYSGELYDIKGMSFELIQCTDEHPFYVRERYRKGHLGVRTFREPKFVKAKDLTKDYYMGYAIDQNAIIPEWNYEQNRQEEYKKGIRIADLLQDGNFWYLMGRFVGDGWIRQDEKHRGIVIACSERNKDKLENSIKSLGYNYCITNERTCQRVTISNKELCEFVKRYGKGAENKKIDADTMHLPVNLLESFLWGYLESDGCYLEKIKSYQVSTVSRLLAISFGQCVTKVFHRPYKVYKCNMPPKTIIEGREVNQRDFYIGRFKNVVDKQDHAFYEDGYIWFPISKIEHSHKECIVFNLEVENDNSYTANGVIVHNCQDFSSAGKMAGGEEGSGTRSSLLWECTKAIEIKRPKYILFENVKNLVSGTFVGGFNKWQLRLESYGYVNFAKVLNTKCFNIPQNRERIFMISILRTDDEPNPQYYFPKELTLEKCLADVLEENVDDRYFLSDEMLVRFCEKSLEEEENGVPMESNEESDDFEDFFLQG